MNVSHSPSDFQVQSDFPHLDDATVGNLVGDIDRSGYAVVRDYLKPADLSHIQAFVENAVRLAGNQYVSFGGHAELSGTVLERIAVSPDFKRLCMDIYRRATGRPAPDQPYHQVLRCLTGSSGQKHSMIFHYDSYVLTALLPIFVPEGNQSGDLVVLPNARPVRRLYLRNLIDKLIVDNPLTQTILRRMTKAGSPRVVRIKMQPGNLYFFWGYRSIHTNEPCDPDKIRATALLHFGDPHRDSALKKWLR